MFITTKAEGCQIMKILVFTIDTLVLLVKLHKTILEKLATANEI